MASLEMESDLLKSAALNGDLEFLRRCIDTDKPFIYYSNVFPKSDSNTNPGQFGNIFHLAAGRNREEFIREAIKILPIELNRQLILQQFDEKDQLNPLHVAAINGNIEIVKLFLDVFPVSTSPSTPSDLIKPWLQKNSLGQTPCHTALRNGVEDCGLQIFERDMELLCNMVDNDGASLLYEAVSGGHAEFALQVLRSPFRFRCDGPQGFTPFHWVTRISEGEEIFRLLLAREPSLLVKKSIKGTTVLHSWASEGKLWPFECFLRNEDISNDLRTVMIEYLLESDMEGCNPLHILATHETYTKEHGQIIKLIIDTWFNDISYTNMTPPWLLQNNQGATPLDLAILHQNTKFAMLLLSLDTNILKAKASKNVLFAAIENKCYEVAEKIVEIATENGWNELLTNDHKLNALHLAPLCSRSFCEGLIREHPELLKGKDKDGKTILHSWVKIGEEWAFEYIFKGAQIDSKWKTQLLKFISTYDYIDGNNPLHIAATCTHESATIIFKLLVEAYKEETSSWKHIHHFDSLPWFKKNKQGDGPLHLAISSKQEEIALYILSLHGDDIHTLLDIYEPVHKPLFLAVKKNCRQVFQTILAKLHQTFFEKYLTDSSTGQNVLHLASYITDEEFGRWLVDQKTLSEFLKAKDKNGKTPIDEVVSVGAEWLVKAMLETVDSSALADSSQGWVDACKKGRVSVLLAFIDSYGQERFKQDCMMTGNSPLHHIQLQNITQYEKFIKIPYMMDLINLQDSSGQTPLHIAIESQNLFFTEALLKTDKIRHDIKDYSGKSAIDLLAHKYRENSEWGAMCKRIGLDPFIKTTYYFNPSSLEELRMTLFVVATLVVTITFTAGFTLPGGFNQNNGEAILAKNAGFLIFILSDTLAIASSMLALICLMFSMLSYTHKTLLLIDHSAKLLLISLYWTLMAFVSGVYTVISSKSLWAAILVIIVICGIAVVSANVQLLCNVLVLIMPSNIKSRSRRHSAQIRRLERDPESLEY